MACAHGICNYTLTHTYELYAATQKKMNWIVLHCNRRRSYSAFLIVYFTIWRVWRLIIKELSLRCDFLCLALLLLLLPSNSTDILLVSTRYYYIFFAPNRKIKAKCRFAPSLVFFTISHLFEWLLPLSVANLLTHSWNFTAFPIRFRFSFFLVCD